MRSKLKCETKVGRPPLIAAACYDLFFFFPVRKYYFPWMDAVLQVKLTLHCVPVVMRFLFSWSPGLAGQKGIWP